MKVQGYKRVALCGLAGVAVVAMLGACSSSSKSSTSNTTLGSSGGSPSTSNAPTGSTVTIGLIGGFTGSQASTTSQAATVAPAWQDWINANGGINGHPVKVLAEDDQFSPAVAQADAKDLESKGVVAIVAAEDFFVETWDAAAIAKGIPIVSGQDADPAWYTKAGMFPTGPNGIVYLTSQEQVAVQNAHSKKFALAYCAEIAACAQATPIMASEAKKLGLSFTSLAISATAPSYVAQCLQLQQQHVDYVQLSLASAPALKVIQSCQSQGYNPTWGATDTTVATAWTKLPNLTVYGPAYAFPTFDTSAAPVATFTAAMQKYAKNSNWHGGESAYTWDGLQTVAKAIEDGNVSPSASVTSQDVLQGLYSFKGENLGGELANKLTYTQGKPNGYNFNLCYFVLELKDGNLTAPVGLTPQCSTAPAQG
jgi:branched-chain amino acid transport system substrate-binding protein